jgi:hypothetical protein
MSGLIAESSYPRLSDMRYNVRFLLGHPVTRTGQQAAIPALDWGQINYFGLISSGAVLAGKQTTAGQLTEGSASLTTEHEVKMHDRIKVTSAVNRDGAQYINKDFQVVRVTVLPNMHYQCEVNNAS